MKPEEIFKYALYGTGVFAIYKIGTKFGIFQTGEEMQQETTTNVVITGDYWKPNFWKDTLNKSGVKNVIKLTPSSQERLVEKLWDAKGVFNDNEDSIYGVFREMNYKTSLSSLADAFLQKKGYDLLTWLKGFLSDNEINNIANIISKYKVGYSTDGKNYK